MINSALYLLTEIYRMLIFHDEYSVVRLVTKKRSPVGFACQNWFYCIFRLVLGPNVWKWRGPNFWTPGPPCGGSFCISGGPELTLAITTPIFNRIWWFLYRFGGLRWRQIHLWYFKDDRNRILWLPVKALRERNPNGVRTCIFSYL